MLNRRLLRIKAMQSIYAFIKSRASAYQLARKQILEEYHEEFMIEGKEKESVLRADQERSITYFEDKYLEDNYIRPSHLNERYIKIADNAIRIYQKNVGKDYRTTKAKMLTDTQNLHRLYLKCMQILIDVADFATHKYEQKGESVPKEKSIYWQLALNPTVSLIKKNEALKYEVSKHNISIDIENIGSWCHLLEKDVNFFEYLHNESEDFSKEVRAVRYFFKDFLLKNEKVVVSFEEQDLNWEENKSILKSMLIKTVKRIDEEKSDETPLMELSKNWEEDKQFFEKLFVSYWENEKLYKELLTDRSDKWPMSRMAELDKLLIGMGVSEMITFSGIPTKVTINEYLEVAKLYSTPKSSQFLNGLLDSIATDLVAQGKIVKSGRGLIDR